MSNKGGERHMQKLEALINELPPELQEEVKDFIEFLLKKRRKKSQQKLKMNWAGALKDLREKYTSVELQHKILKWRVGGDEDIVRY
jgi:galactose-1-phosphate uridylyltransferase